MLLYAAQAHLWAGESLLAFVRLFKLLGLAGEALSMWALWRFASPRAFAVYACLPAPILVSGFHGNTDCLCAALVLVAAIAFDRKSYLLSGILWAAALNVKLMPLALIPLLFLGAPTRKAFLQIAAGLALGLTPFVPVALVAGKAMYTGMVRYNSIPDGWGLTALFTQMASLRGLDSVFEPLRNWWLVAGRFAVLLAIIAVGLVSRLRRPMPMVEQAALPVPGADTRVRRAIRSIRRTAHLPRGSGGRRVVGLDLRTVHWRRLLDFLGIVGATRIGLADHMGAGGQGSGDRGVVVPGDVRVGPFAQRLSATGSGSRNGGCEVRIERCVIAIFSQAIFSQADILPTL
jgi:hypothetical protein